MHFSFKNHEIKVFQTLKYFNLLIFPSVTFSILFSLLSSQLLFLCRSISVNFCNQSRYFSSKKEFHIHLLLLDLFIFILCCNSGLMFPKPIPIYLDNLLNQIAFPLALSLLTVFLVPLLVLGMEVVCSARFLPEILEILVLHLALIQLFQLDCVSWALHLQCSWLTDLLNPSTVVLSSVMYLMSQILVHLVLVCSGICQVPDLTLQCFQL